MADSRNAEGYSDPTAFKAMRNIEMAEMSTRAEIRRGDIFYITDGYSVGSEQWSGRPAIIVSNDLNNRHSDTVEVVYLTTSRKKNLPTHVTVKGTGRRSTALCEQITTVSVSRLGGYMGAASSKELADLEKAILISLDLLDRETSRGAKLCTTT